MQVHAISAPLSGPLLPPCQLPGDHLFLYQLDGLGLNRFKNNRNTKINFLNSARLPGKGGSVPASQARALRGVGLEVLLRTSPQANGNKTKPMVRQFFFFAKVTKGEKQFDKNKPSTANRVWFLKPHPLLGPILGEKNEPKIKCWALTKSNIGYKIIFYNLC